MRLYKEHKLLPEIYTLIITKLEQEGLKNKHEEMKFVAETLIVCNQPDQFEKLINALNPNVTCRCGSFEEDCPYNCFFCNCKQTIEMLHRSECEQVFNFYCNRKTLERLNDDNEGLNENLRMHLKYFVDNRTDDFMAINIFIGAKKRSFMYLIRDHPFSKNDIEEALQMIPNLRHDINIPNANGYTPLRMYMTHKMNVEAVTLLIENGSDINIKCFGRSIFTSLFDIKDSDWRNTEFEYRRILELLLYSNPSLNDDTAIVAIALSLMLSC